MLTFEEYQQLRNFHSPYYYISPRWYRRIMGGRRDNYLTGLWKRKVDQLVDFLDGVRTVPSAFHQFTKQTPQVLGAFPATDGVAQACLHQLQTICGCYATLPSSCIVSGDIARVGDGPIVVGAITDVWEGTHGSKKVSIKCLRVPLTKDEIRGEVCILCGASLSRLLKNAYGPRSSSKRSFYGNP